MLFDRWDRSRRIDVEFPFKSRLRPAMQHLAYRIYSEPGLQAGVTESWLVDETAAYRHPRRFEDLDECGRRPNNHPPGPVEIAPA
jgi:hypothetical protein